MVIGIIFGGTGAEELINLQAVKDIEAVFGHYNLTTRRFYLNAPSFKKRSFQGVNIFLVVDSNCKDKRNRRKIIQYIKKHKIPFIGQSESTISLARDKKKFNTLLSGRGIHTPASLIFDSKKLKSSVLEQCTTFTKKIGYPIIIKDNFGSSSENIVLCENDEEFMEKYNTIAQKCKKILIEQYIGGVDGIIDEKV